LGFTARTYYLSRRGQLTDRYAKAITQLASEKLTERLGGIYALEHLMAESSRDHNTVVEVLAAFVRETTSSTLVSSATRAQADADTKRAAAGPTEDRRANRRPATDVQAALTVLARRPDRTEPNHLNLARTDLQGADLVGAQLQGANLEEAQLQGAKLGKAQLAGANLAGAQLQGADLGQAQLLRTILFKAQLQGAFLNEARVTVQQLRGAVIDASTQLDSELRPALDEAATPDGTLPSRVGRRSSL